MNLSRRGSAEQGPFDAAGFGGPGCFGRMSNPLEQRFLDGPAFRQTYLRAYHEVYDRLLAGGSAVGELRRLEETINDVEGAASVSLEARQLEQTLRERTAALRERTAALRSALS
jgi:spore coat protein CotH